MMFSFLKKLKNQIDAFLESIWAKSPQNKCLFVQHWVTILGRLIGCEVTERNYKPHWWSYMPWVFITEYFLLLMYSVVYYGRKHDYIKCLSVICFVGVVAPVLKNCYILNSILTI